MIERREILGITSNPSIFEKAIISDTDYQSDLQLMAWAGLNAEEIFYRLAIQDIRDAAISSDRIMKPVTGQMDL